MKLSSLLSAAALGLSLFAAACGDKPADATPADAAAAQGAPQAAAPATGTVIEVKMVTDDKGNYFEPAAITAKAGDVLRFTLVSGVHNASFPADKNPGGSGLPEATQYLQLAGQTADVTVPATPGEYTFQCDPHAALGMVGKVTVR
jgi:plastocyanin